MGDSCTFWHPGLCRELKKNGCQLGNACLFRYESGNNNNHRQAPTPLSTPRGNRRCGGQNLHYMGSMMPAVEVSAAVPPPIQKVEIEAKVKGDA